MRYQNYSNGPNIVRIIGLILIIFFFATVGLSLILNFLPFILIIYFVNNAFKIQSIQQGISDRTQDHTRFVELLINILVHAFKADGIIDERELAVARNFFSQVMGFKSQQMVWVNDLINVSIKSNYQLNEVTEEFNRSFNYDSKLIVLQLVYRVVVSDQDFSESEKVFVDSLVYQLKINPIDHARIKSMFDTNLLNKDRHYETLGITKGASQSEIKKAYRNLVKENHPDKVHHLGPEFKKVAEDKLIKIKEAYEALSNG